MGTATWLWVGLGGFIGSILRFSVYRVVALLEVQAFPLATFIINITGCFLIGWAASATGRLSTFENFSAFFTVGVLGAYTTFSTFGLENLKLIESGQLWLAILNSCLQVVVGVFAVYLGRSF